MSSAKPGGQNDLERRTFLKGVAAGAVGLGLAGAFPRDVLADGASRPPAR